MFFEFSGVRSVVPLLQHFWNTSPIMKGCDSKERVMGDEQQAGQHCVQKVLLKYLWK